MQLVKNKFSIRIWMKNIDKILFKFKDFELVLYKIFKERVINITVKKIIMNSSIKLNLSRNFKLRLNIEPIKIKVLNSNINPPNILNVNFDPLDLFLNDS